MQGEAAMRWLTSLIVLLGLAATGPAVAVPQPDAEAAYARGDYATAFKLWLPLAEQGSARAQLNIGRMYERGEWVAQDQAMADEWYRRAAAQNARDAAMPAPQIDRTATAVQAVQGPPTQQVSPPMQTTYTPPATPPPVAASAYGVPVSYPVAVPYRPAPVHHHHHGHRH